MDSSPLATVGHSSSSHSSSDCSLLFRQSNAVSFSHHRDWNLSFDSELKPKICIRTSMPADLEHILPWMFYHKVIGASNFFLFVEGKAASPVVSKVLESIPAFIIASTATEEEMLNWYHECVVWTERSLNLKLLRKGILTLIYTPATIIQGLRESGILGSVVASAQTSLSKNEFLASIENSNSSRSAASASSPSRKIGRKQESQATAKKTLEIMSFAYHEAAVPPLSPLVMDGQLKIEA